MRFRHCAPIPAYQNDRTDALCPLHAPTATATQPLPHQPPLLYQPPITAAPTPPPQHGPWRTCSAPRACARCSAASWPRPCPCLARTRSSSRCRASATACRQIGGGGWGCLGGFPWGGVWLWLRGRGGNRRSVARRSFWYQVEGCGLKCTHPDHILLTLKKSQKKKLNIINSAAMNQDSRWPTRISWI
jgi:hypothetical protein